MEDTLEAYLKIAGVRKEKQVDNEKLNGIKSTLDYKKRAEEYAQRVVEMLIEGKLQPQIFLKSLNCINEALYEDVVDERSITKLCGYPICGRTIPDMPDKKFIILAKVKKVYDLTDRKKYCSNFCYKASTHIKKQIDNSPLWLRKAETIYEYKLLPYTNTGLSPGEELINGIQPEPEDTDKEVDVNFTSVGAFTEACLDEAEDNLPDDDPDKIDKDIKFTPDNIAEVIQNIGKSILKPDTNGKENEFVQADGEIPSSSTSRDCNEKKKIKFVDNIIEKPTTSKIKTQKEKEGLKASIDNICKTLNINLNLNKQSNMEIIENNFKKIEINPEKNEVEEIIEVKQSNQEIKIEENEVNIKIDHDKMNKIIEKVNASEKLKQKQPILINITKKSAQNVKANNLEPALPKYAQRIIAISNKTPPKRPLSQHKEMNTITEKVKNIDLAKRRNVNIEDEKMRKILEKIQKKNTTQKKPQVIVVDSLINPEIHRAHVEQVVKVSTEMKTILKSDECIQITSAFRKWLTLETFLFLYGKEKIREMISDEQLDSYFSKLKVADMETSKQLRYFGICRRLQLKEIQDEKFDTGCMDTDGNHGDHSRGALKPVPQFQALKEEVDAMNLKTQSFYSGHIVPKRKKLEENVVDVKQNEEEDVVLPLVDASNTNALRKSVFIRSILQYINNHLYEMSLPESTFINVQALIKTFKLESNNVVFKPVQWNIIALILIHCLMKEDGNLLKSQTCQKYLETFNKKFVNFKQLLVECHEIIEHFDTFIELHILGNN